MGKVPIRRTFMPKLTRLDQRRHAAKQRQIQIQHEVNASFGAWLTAAIESHGNISEFAKTYQISSIRVWAKGWSLPKRWQVPKLAAALAAWTGESITPEDLLSRLDSKLDDPRSFAVWLRTQIENVASCDAFAKKYNLGYSALQSWVSGKTLPVGKRGQAEAIAAALTDWTGKPYDYLEIAQRVKDDPKWVRLPDPIKERTRRILANTTPVIVETTGVVL